MRRALAPILLVGCAGSERPPWPFDGAPPGTTTSGGWQHVAVADLPARVFTPPPRTTWAEVTCTLVSDPEEVHQERTSDGSSIALYGLLPDEDYACVLGSDLGSTQTSFRTGPPPDWLGATWTVEGATTGYTLFNHGTDDRTARQAKLVIVDPEGRLRWAHFVADRPADLDASVVDGFVMYGGGYSIRPRIVDLAGQVLVEAPAPSTGGVYHHEVGRLDDGGVVSLATLQHTLGEQTWAGMSIELLDPALSTVRSVWTTQRGLDEGWLGVPGPLTDDPYHLNAVSFVPEQDGWLVSLRAEGLVVLLDRDTGDLRWRLGLGGDFALVDDDGQPLPAAEWFFGQHAPKMQKDRILMHDNGWGRPGGGASRIVEYALDEDTMTARIVWAFTEEGWYEPIWGDVDRLPDGHVLITRGHCGSCLPDDPDTTQLVEVDPNTDQVVWRLVMDTTHDAGYRAQRIDGCALFSNRKYCPDAR